MIRRLFVAGFVIALFSGTASAFNIRFIINIRSWLLFALLVLGIIIGFMCTNAKDPQRFLFASIALTFAAAGGFFGNTASFLQLGLILQSITAHIAALVAPAALVIALYEIYGFIAEQD